MKKRGFVSTSLIYTFFIIFLALMLFLLTGYSKKRFMLDEYKYDLKTTFANYEKRDIELTVYNCDDALNINEDTIDQDCKIIKNVPPTGYNLIEHSYCTNVPDPNNAIKYENGKIKITSPNKTSCRAYFKSVGKDIDLKIFVKKQGETGEGTLTKTIPRGNYEFDNVVCRDRSNEKKIVTNNHNGTRVIEYIPTEHTFKINTTEKLDCIATFIQKDMDIILDIYKQNINGTYEYNGTKYILVDGIPNTLYPGMSLDDNYVCGKTSTKISVSADGQLEIEAEGKDRCSLYFKSNDIEIGFNIYMESPVGNQVWGGTTGKLYSKIYMPPQSGYKLVNYTCEDGRTKVRYENGKLIGEGNLVSTSCDVFFDLGGE